MRRAAVAAGLLAVAFVAFSAAVASGVLHGADGSVASAVARLYRPWLLPAFQGIAMLGGLEATVLIAVGLFVYLRRLGYRAGAWAVLALPMSTVAELADKATINHPATPSWLSHPDGPSLTELLPGNAAGGWSYPSGHMTRAVVVYGMLAFLAYRLARRPLVRRLAIPAAVLFLLLMAFDRLYLEVHWESDVIGGALLGGTFLAASVSWLEWSEARAE